MAASAKVTTEIKGTGTIQRVAGPVVTAIGVKPRMYDVMLVGTEQLMGEVIQILGEKTVVQVYEETSGIRPGEPVADTGKPLTVELGPGLLGNIYDGLGDRFGRAAALHNLGSALCLTGSLAAAADALNTAMSIYLDLGNRLGQAEVLNHTGDYLLRCGESGQASAHYQRAQRLAREVHSPREEAHALQGAAHCALDQHDVDTAVDQLRQACLTYRRIGAPEADLVAAELAELTPSAPNAA